MAIIPLTKGYSTIVDDEDFQWLNQWKWCYNSGYAARYAGGRKAKTYIAMHRLISNPPEGLEVDHINRNKLDNRRDNLRNVTRQVNMQNKGPYVTKRGLLIIPGQHRSRSKKGVPYTGYKNKSPWVAWRAERNKFVASVVIDGKKKSLGNYLTREEAQEAIQEYEKAA